MKKTIFYVLSLFFIISCSNETILDKNEDQAPETEPKEYILSFNLAKELGITEEPLARSGSEKNDVYGVMVASSPVHQDIFRAYAYGVFDDLSNVEIRLLEGYKYWFRCDMVENGKNLLYQTEEGLFYEPYFNLSVTNEFEYSIYFPILSVGEGRATLKNGKTYVRPNLIKYFGLTNNFIPQEGKTISIDLKRMVFGAKFIVEDLTEGSIRIQMEEAPTLVIHSGENNYIKDIFTFSSTYHDEYILADGYSEDIKVEIYWDKEDGTSVLLNIPTITFKRNILTVITFKVEDLSMNNGIEITKEEEVEMQEENISFSPDNGIDTGIDS